MAVLQFSWFNTIYLVSFIAFLRDKSELFLKLSFRSTFLFENFSVPKCVCLFYVWNTYVLLSILIFRWKSVSPAPRGDKMSIITKVNWITCCIQTAKKQATLIRTCWKWNGNMHTHMHETRVCGEEWNSCKFFETLNFPCSVCLHLSRYLSTLLFKLRNTTF